MGRPKSSTSPAPASVPEMFGAHDRSYSLRSCSAQIREPHPRVVEMAHVRSLSYDHNNALAERQAREESFRYARRAAAGETDKRFFVIDDDHLIVTEVRAPWPPSPPPMRRRVAPRR